LVSLLKSNQEDTCISMQRNIFRDD